MNPHVSELRTRLLVWLGSSVLAAGALWAAQTPVLQLALAPLGGQGLQATGVAELFWVYLKIALWGGLVASVPVLLYQIWAFMRPGLRADEAKWLALILLGSPVLTASGVVFAQGVLMPLLVQFFLGFSAPGVAVVPTVHGYIGLWLTTLFTFGVAFNFPVALLLLFKLGVLNPAKVAANRRFVVVGIFIIAAVATPPDPVSQLLLAAPLYLLFEATLLLARWLIHPAR
jgi:sec-independent protein translocase protein TatC